MSVTAEDSSGEGEREERGILIDSSDGAENGGSGARGSFAVGEVAELSGESRGEDGGWIKNGAVLQALDWEFSDLRSGGFRDEVW